MPRRLLLHAAGLALGAAAGLLGSFVHPARLGGAPVGLLCGLALTAVAVAVGGLLAGTRSGAVLAALGWVLPVLLLSAPRPEGDLVVTGSLLGYTWLVGGLLVAGGTASWPYAGAGRSPSAGGPAGR